MQATVAADQVGIHSIVRTTFQKKALEADGKHVETYRKTSPLPLEEAQRILPPAKLYTSNGIVTWFGELEDGQAFGSNTEYYVEYHTAEREYAQIVFIHDSFEPKWRTFVDEHFYPEVNTEDVAVKFWNMDNYGNPARYSKYIKVNQWDQIASNYPSAVRGDLENLVNLRCSEEGGKIVLLHGPPGTGKTHMIRALADAWRDWCDIEYIVDPEQLFGKANYMINSMIFDPDDEYEPATRKKERFRLVVIEDASEFIRSDAKAQVGQGLSRLLNLSDGIIGQGLRLIILVTTNDDIKQLNPAMTRPGRCLATIGFDKFTAEEGEQWLRNDGVNMPPYPAAPVTLAELYELKAQEQINNAKETPSWRPGMYL